MKIKPPSRKNKLRSLRRKQFLHWWLVQEKPKKLKRCRLNRHRLYVKSEFITMCEMIEVREARLQW